MTVDTEKLRTPEPTFPRWIGTSGWTVGRKSKQGFATLVTAPGQIERTDRCDHRHRTIASAKSCGDVMALARNTLLRAQEEDDMDAMAPGNFV